VLRRGGTPRPRASLPEPELARERGRRGADPSTTPPRTSTGALQSTRVAILGRPTENKIAWRAGAAPRRCFLKWISALLVLSCLQKRTYPSRRTSQLNRSSSQQGVWKFDEDARAERHRSEVYWIQFTMPQRFRIVEWTSIFEDGSRKVSYEVLRQTEGSHTHWQRLGTSDTLVAARKALLFYAPNASCWSS
jgi:hypothetical protein